MGNLTVGAGILAVVWKMDGWRLEVAFWIGEPRYIYVVQQ